MAKHMHEFVKNIKAVLLDVDDTILDFSLCSKEDIKLCLSQHGIPYSDHLFETFERHNSKYWQDIEAGRLTVEELRKIRWTGIFRELGIEADGQKFELDFISHLKDFAIPMEGARELMQYLSTRYRIYIVSNATHEQQRRRLGDAGLEEYIDDMFTSLDIGFVKPTKEYFDVCFSKIDPPCKPSETIIIGDSLTADIRGAIDYGIHTCWFNRHGTPQPADMHIDFTITALTDVIRDRLL